MHTETEYDDTFVQQATQALRNVSVPAGPSDETVQATLAAINSHSEPGSANPVPSVRNRLATAVRRYRVAACILVPLPIAALVVSLFLPSLTTARHTAAFALLIAQLRSARTVEYRVTYTNPDRPATSQHVLVKGVRSRIELDNGPIMITDPVSHRVLTLMPDQKKAFLASMPANGGSGKDTQSALLFFDRVKQLQAEPGAYRGVRQQDGRQVAEYQTQQKGAQFNVLADPATNSPIRITMTIPLFQLGMTMTDFVFDAQLSDDVFSLTPPAGYTVTEQPDEGDGVVASDPQSGQMVGQVEVTVSDADFAEPVEQDVINYLQAVAEFYQGQFPSAEIFDDPAKDCATLPNRMQKANAAQRQALNEEISRYIMKRQRSRAYFQTVLSVQPLYVGQGVKQGEAERPVLAWAAPGANKARVVYGDLSIKDVDLAGGEFQSIKAAASAKHAATTQPAEELHGSIGMPATQCDLSAPVEQDVLNYIRVLAERNHGVFPSAREMSELMEQANRERQQAQTATPKEQKRVSDLFIIELRAGAYFQRIKPIQPTPVGGGVKFGDATKPVFLWGLADRKHVRVVYGDLHVRQLDMNSPEFKAIADAAKAVNVANATEIRTASKPAEKKPQRAPLSLAEALAPGGMARLPYYGVQMGESPDRSGMRIEVIFADTPAEVAGLNVGDVVTHINGQPATTRIGANELLGLTRPGDRVTWTVRRGPTTRDVELTVDPWPKHRSKVTQSLPSGNTK